MLPHHFDKLLWVTVLTLRSQKAPTSTHVGPMASEEHVFPTAGQVRIARTPFLSPEEPGLASSSAQAFLNMETGSQMRSGGLHSKTREPTRRGPDPEKVPLPKFVKRELHNQGKCEPCLYNTKQGCWYGQDCRFCHFCTADQIRKKQSRQYYMERLQRRERGQTGAPFD